MTSMLRQLQNYMRAREAIRIAKEERKPRPWTDDPILQKYKFTNVHREDDYTTRQLRALYVHDQMPFDLMIYNAAVARYFGTWEFYAALGWQTAYNPRDIIKLAKQRMEQDKPVFTQAYIITNGGKSMPKEEYVVKEVLGPLWLGVKSLAIKVSGTYKWEEVYREMRKLPGFGGQGFMAKEVLQDFIMMNPNTFVDEYTWTPVGPGARRGLNRVQGRHVDAPISEPKAIAEVQNLHRALAPWWGMVLEHRKLSAHDVQFVLCEFDKYERVRHGGKAKHLYVPRRAA